MKKSIFKSFFIACFIVAVLCFLLCAHVASAEMIYPSDDFTTMDASEFTADSVVGISTNKDKTHGAIPSETWGSPVRIADESYLIYRITNGDDEIGPLFTALKANLWNQNDETAHEENAVKVYVGASDSEFTLVRAYGCNDAPSRDLSVVLDLTEAVSGLNTAYVKIELVQSKVHCENSGCTNGMHVSGCGKTIATSDGMIDIWHFGVKLYSVRFYGEEAVIDEEQPVPNGFKALIPNSVPTSAFYTFPEIVFTDNVDETVDYNITMTDPYNIDTELPLNATGFFAEYEGIYTFEIRASDKSGNTYVDKFSVNCVLGAGLPSIGFENIPVKNGRQGIEYVIEPLSYLPEEVDELDIYAVNPSGERVEIKNGRFVPDAIGEYRIKYEATNSYGTSKLLVRVYVKYNVGDGNVYEMVKDSANWLGAAAQSENGVYISGEAYSQLPFDIKNGIKITFTLPPEMNSWIGLYFTRTSGFNRYYLDDKTEYGKNGCAPGLYVLIYRQSDAYYCNVDYVGLSRISMEVLNHYNCGLGPDITIALTKVDGEDNIRFYINGVKNENYELNYSVNASVCADNEDFCYIGFGNCSASGITLKSVDILDNVAPIIRLSSSIPANFKVGDKYILPDITAIDAHDGETEYSVRLFSPDGKLVSHVGEIVLDKEGVWYCIVRTEDASGNVASEIYALNVGNVSKTRTVENGGGCSSYASGGACALGVAAVSAAILFLLIKRKRADG